MLAGKQMLRFFHLRKTVVIAVERVKLSCQVVSKRYVQTAFFFDSNLRLEEIIPVLPPVSDRRVVAIRPLALHGQQQLAACGRLEKAHFSPYVMSCGIRKRQARRLIHEVYFYE